MQFDVNLLAALADLRSAQWDAIRDNDTLRSLDRASQLSNVCETFRRLHCPDAERVFVTCDRTSGRPLRVFALIAETPRRLVMVYDETKPPNGEAVAS